MYRLIFEVLASLVLLGALLCGGSQGYGQTTVPLAGQKIAGLISPFRLPVSDPRTPLAESPSAPDVSVGGALRTLAARAGVVFIGQVRSIERKGGLVEVNFTVQQAVQGSVGATYTLREWTGLWTDGAPRYTLGQRAMVFLHPANAAGLSSPVDGMDGIVLLVPMGANAAPLLDVRRLATRVQRAVGEAMTSEAVALPEAVAAIVQPEQALELQKQQLPIGWKPVVRTPVLLEVRDAAN